MGRVVIGTEFSSPVPRRTHLCTQTTIQLNHNKLIGNSLIFPEVGRGHVTCWQIRKLFDYSELLLRVFPFFPISLMKLIHLGNIDNELTM